MSLENRPNRIRAGLVRHTLKTIGDNERAFQLWKDFKWQATQLQGDYNALNELIGQFEERVKAEIVSLPVKTEVLNKFTVMKNRLSEFTDVPVTCSRCAAELAPEDYRRQVEGDIEAYLCAKCAALP